MARAQGGAYKLYVGVDVAATTVTAAWIALDNPMSSPITVPQTAQGHAALCALLDGFIGKRVNGLVGNTHTGSCRHGLHGVNGILHVLCKDLLNKCCF